MKKYGVPKIVEQQAHFPFIVISPQSPRGEYWNVDRLSALLAQIIVSYPVDPDGLYSIDGSRL